MSLSRYALRQIKTLILNEVEQEKFLQMSYIRDWDIPVTDEVNLKSLPRPFLFFKSRTSGAGNFLRKDKICEADVPVKVIQEIRGHKDIQTTLDSTTNQPDFVHTCFRQFQSAEQPA